MEKERTAAAINKAAERERHRQAGRVPVTVYVLPAYRWEVRAIEARLRKREAREKVAS